MNSKNDNEWIQFDRYQISLPKGDLKKEWEKLKKYMDIKLEDYVYQEPKKEESPVDSDEHENEQNLIISQKVTL